MSFDEIVSAFSGSTCIVSVKKTDDGNYDDIRIVTGNMEFLGALDEMRRQAGGMEFVPDSPYERYLPKDIGFEDLCYRAAILKVPIHTSAHQNVLGNWFNLHLTPLEIDDGNTCYCALSPRICDPTEINITSGGSHSTAEDVLRTCIRLRGTDDFKKTMDSIIADIREICGAEVGTVMLMDTEQGSCSILATNVRGGSTLKRVTQFYNFFDLAGSWIGMIGEGDCLIIKNDKDMNYVREINPIWHQSLMEAGVKSVVMFPLRYNKEVLGFIWATNFDTDHLLQIKETLELTTFFISAEIAGQEMLRKLVQIGFSDMLTGVKNRNAMNNRVSEIVDGTESIKIPFGVIFLDLNGLKTVNDEQGHTAGDLLLKKAALILQEVFAGEDIYRAGGDEFVVLLSGITKEEFEEKIAALRSRSDDNEGVSFAVGAHHVASGCDIRDAMHLADEKMYSDKKEYYEKHPEKKKR